MASEHSAPDVQDEGETLLAQALCTRLCHDMEGVVGAVAAGVELLMEEVAEGAPPDPESLALLSDSAVQAASRLKLLRLVLGQCDDGPSDERAFREALGGGLSALGGAASPLVLDWPEGWPGPTGRREAQLLAVLTLLAVEGLPRGGRIGVWTAPGPLLCAEARGERAALPPHVLALGDAAPRPLARDGAMARYAAGLAQALGFRITVGSEPGCIRITAQPKGGGRSA